MYLLMMPFKLCSVRCAGSASTTLSSFGALVTSSCASTDRCRCRCCRSSCCCCSSCCSHLLVRRCVFEEGREGGLTRGEKNGLKRNAMNRRNEVGPREGRKEGGKEKTKSVPIDNAVDALQRAVNGLSLHHLPFLLPFLLRRLGHSLLRLPPVIIPVAVPVVVVVPIVAVQRLPAAVVCLVMWVSLVGGWV